jgi:allophanate hydrolase subunit 2
MVTGAIQVPPDGRPIVLMPDHATVGGYPVIACVIAVDLPVLGRLRPGDLVAFSPVDPADAHEARRRRDQVLAAMVSGWFPTAAGT